MDKRTRKTSLAVLAVVSALASCAITHDKGSGMSFFVTSTGIGDGGALGGLAGADKHCQALGTAAGAGRRTWRAYLSTQSTAGALAINARDRIGAGPWRNAKGTVIAADVDQLHSSNGLNKQTALDERGETINGRGDIPNVHDILTGSQPDGRAISSTVDATCSNWTRSSRGAAMVGHHDRTGLDDSAEAKSWNSSHLSRGCSQDFLVSTGGSGLFYCFAVE
jgi:hypothetical protein